MAVPANKFTHAHVNQETKTETERESENTARVRHIESCQITQSEFADSWGSKRVERLCIFWISSRFSSAVVLLSLQLLLLINWYNRALIRFLIRAITLSLCRRPKRRLCRLTTYALGRCRLRSSHRDSSWMGTCVRMWNSFSCDPMLIAIIMDKQV